MSGKRARRVGRPPGPRRDPAERREELLDACVRCIRTKGADVSMAEMADEAGVSRPILYDHFGDRAGIAGALVHRYTGQLRDTIEPVLGTDATLRAAVRAGIDTFCRFVDAEPDLWLFLQAASADAAGPSIEREVIDVLTAALVEAGIDAARATVWASAVLGAAFAAAEVWAHRRPIPRSELVEHLEALLFSGLEGLGVADIPGPFTAPGQPT